jgi:hypothetical protein
MVTTQPNPNNPVATVGLLPDPPVKPQEAAALAIGMRQRLRGKYQSMYIYVFANQQAAQAFEAHQEGRQGAPLASGDYEALSDVWPNTLARIESNGGTNAVRYPQTNPGGWWK